MTAQIIKPGEVKPPESSGEVEKGMPVWVTESTGDTVLKAMRGFQMQSPRKIYNAHNLIIAFSNEAARQGVRSLLDYFIRNYEERPNVFVLIVDGKASDLLKTEFELGKIPAMEIHHLIERSYTTSEAIGIRLKEFTTRLMSKTTAPVATYIELSAEGTGKKVQLAGTAVFKQDKLVGRLDKSQTRGLLWIMDEVQSGIIVVRGPEDEGKGSLEIIHAKSKIIPELLDGEPYIKVEIKVVSNLNEQMSTWDLTKPDYIAFLEKQQTVVIKNEVMAVLEKAQELNTDIFGFGDAFHRKYSREWKEMEPWWDDFFPVLDVKVDVKSKIRYTGSITRPAMPE